MSKYYIESHSNLIKIYKDSVDNNLVFNNILFSSYSEAKFYLLHFKDTIFEKLGYTNCYDEDLKEYTSFKNKINDLEQKIITIDTIIKNMKIMSRVIFIQRNGLLDKKLLDYMKMY